jgi:hypothetical protein
MTRGRARGLVPTVADQPICRANLETRQRGRAEEFSLAD